MGGTSHMWLLSIWNLTLESEEQNIDFNFNDFIFKWLDMACGSCAGQCSFRGWAIPEGIHSILKWSWERWVQEFPEWSLPTLCPGTWARAGRWPQHPGKPCSPYLAPGPLPPWPQPSLMCLIRLSQPWMFLDQCSSNSHIVKPVKMLLRCRLWWGRLGIGPENLHF